MKKLLTLITITITLASCGKQEMFTQLKDGSHKLVYESGKMIESVGQAPRIIANRLLGTSEDTDEEVQSTNNDIDTLEDKVDDNFNYVLDRFADVYMEIAELDYKVDFNNKNIIKKLQKNYDDLLVLINEGKDNSKIVKQLVDLRHRIAHMNRDIKAIVHQLNHYRRDLSRLKHDLRHTNGDTYKLKRSINILELKIKQLENGQGELNRKHDDDEEEDEEEDD